ncbi:MAG: bifunctional diguanylate cyclase/phosphodiesterase [Bacillota bacterium]
MNLYNQTANHDDLIQLFKVKKEFVSSTDIDAAGTILLQELMNYFDFDRVYIGMKTFSEQLCVPIIEHLKGQPSNHLGAITAFSEYAKYANVETGEHEEEFIKLADTNNHFFGADCEKLSELLSHMGYVKSNGKMPKECLLFYIKEVGSFSFMIMERHKDQEKIFSEAERLLLSDMYDTFRLKAKEQALIERSYNDSHVKDTILKNESIPVCLVDKKNKRIVYYNEEYKKLVPDTEIGAKYSELFFNNKYLGKDYEVNLRINSETLVHYKKSDNEDYAVTYLIKKVLPITLIDGTEVYMVYAKDSADYIRQLEGVDLLTSAYSEKGFVAHYERLNKNKIGKNYMLCTFDISKFKHINDIKGFTVGNAILKKIANIIHDFIRDQEIFCRISSDQFALLLQCDSNCEAKARINVLFDKLEAMRELIYPDLGIAYVCGVVNVERDTKINLLIDKANMARKTAKGSHKNTISFFNEEMERTLVNEVKIESQVVKAVENGEFVPYLQPKFNLATMEICGAEALVRWITPTGMIFPDSFIPLFEKNGFITTLDFIVYKKIMVHIRSCLDQNIKVYPISLNVSRNHIRNKDFTSQILSLVEEYNIPLELLELEITESVFVEDHEVLKFFVDNIKHIKIKVSIDDFGSAYSSLQVLKDLNMDILKIDKGFIDNIGNGNEFTKDELVLKNIINLAKDLKCKVICEGVETEQQVKILKNIGCELGQGYVFARPMPIAEYEEKFLTK